MDVTKYCLSETYRDIEVTVISEIMNFLRTLSKDDIKNQILNFVNPFNTVPESVDCPECPSITDSSNYRLK